MLLLVVSCISHVSVLCLQLLVYRPCNDILSPEIFHRGPTAASAREDGVAYVLLHAKIQIHRKICSAYCFDGLRYRSLRSPSLHRSGPDAQPRPGPSLRLSRHTLSTRTSFGGREIANLEVTHVESGLRLWHSIPLGSLAHTAIKPADMVDIGGVTSGSRRKQNAVETGS